MGFSYKRFGKALERYVVGFSRILANLPKPVTNKTTGLFLQTPKIV